MAKTKSKKTTSIEKEAKEHFKERAQQMQKKYKGKNKVIAAADFDPIRTKRRINTLVECEGKALEIAKQACPNERDDEFWRKTWIELNGAPVLAYDGKCEHDGWLIAAAIWILDCIVDQDQLFFGENMKQLLSLVLSDSDDDSNNCYDYVTVPEYNSELLIGVISILGQRNHDCTGLDKPRSKYNINRSYNDNYVASNMNHQQVPSREKFEKLIALIEPDRIMRATKNFEDKVWEWLSIAFRGCLIIDKISEKAHKKAERFGDALQTEIGEWCMSELNNSINPQPISVLQNTNALTASDQDVLKRLRWAKNRNDRCDELYDEMMDIYKNKFLFEANGADFAGSMDHLGIRGTKPYIDELCDLSQQFEPGDPYEMCFALLYLLDSGSNIPWLYGPCLNVMTAVSNKLPWCFVTEAALNYEPWLYKEMTREEREQSRDSFSKKYQPPKLRSWYENIYQYTDHSGRQFSLNLAQIVYNITGCVMTRDMSRYDVSMKDLAEFGVTKKELKLPLLYCMNLLDSNTINQKIQTMMFELQEDMHGNRCAEENTDAKEDANATASNSQSLEKMRIELDKCRKENKELKSHAYRFERENRDLRKKLEQDEKEHKLERQELYDLRELVFRMNSESDDCSNNNNEQMSEISFPCNTNCRTVVFGGHDTWLKQIKPKLPNVRFFSRDQRPDVNLIRSSDVVWVQTNAMSHSMYNTISKEARKYQIPIKYFSSSGAEQCAIQIIEFEKDFMSLQ